MTKARDIANAGTAFTTVTPTELGYVDGVTSAIQTQINTKQAVVSGVNDTEIGYLDGVTSAIQTQLDAKIPKTLTTTTGDIIYASGANTPARLGVGSTGNVLTVAGGVPTWAAPSAGGMTQLATGNIGSNMVTTISSISGAYNNLLLVIRNYKPSNDGDSLCVRVNSDSTSNRHSQVSVGSGGPNTFTGTYWLLDNGQDDTNNGYTAYVQFNDYANTTTWKTGNVWSSAVNAATPTSYVYWNRWSTYNQVDAITSLQLFSTVQQNNPNGGTYILYGVK